MIVSDVALPIVALAQSRTLAEQAQSAMLDPLAGSSWSTPATVEGFTRSLPNDTLLRLAAVERARVPGGRVLDIGCGAGRNAVPLAHQGWRVVGTDLSWPMLLAAAGRRASDRETGRLSLAVAPMDRLPVRDRAIDLIVAHGIWNLARSAAEFRRAIGEASRVAAPRAALFVFTFSRSTLPADAAPVPGEPFVFVQFSGQPQCFVTADQLVEELGAAGFAPDDTVPFTEHNLPAGGAIHVARPPVIFEAAFRFVGA
jgi:SAM-dependent methyltransferase